MHILESLLGPTSKSSFLRTPNKERILSLSESLDPCLGNRGASKKLESGGDTQAAANVHLQYLHRRTLLLLQEKRSISILNEISQSSRAPAVFSWGHYGYKASVWVPLHSHLLNVFSQQLSICHLIIITVTVWQWSGQALFPFCRWGITCLEKGICLSKVTQVVRGSARMRFQSFDVHSSSPP